MVRVPSVFAWNGRFDEPRRISFYIARNEVLRSFRHIRIGIKLRRIEAFRIPIRRDPKKKRRLLVDRVSSFEIVRERPVPRVRAS